MKSAWVFALGAVLMISAAALAAPQDKAPQVDMKKIMAEVAGAYEFDAMGQLMTITFFEKDGKLFVAPEGGASEEVVPVKGDNPLKFDVTVASNGNHFDIVFARNEKGEVDKCTLNGGDGMEFTGQKKKK